MTLASKRKLPAAGAPGHNSQRRKLDRRENIIVLLGVRGGLLSVAGQVITFYLRFGRWNTDSPLTDYLFFFLAGALGGLIPIFFLDRQVSARGR